MGSYRSRSQAEEGLRWGGGVNSVNRLVTGLFLTELHFTETGGEVQSGICIRDRKISYRETSRCFHASFLVSGVLARVRKNPETRHLTFDHHPESSLTTIALIKH